MASERFSHTSTPPPTVQPQPPVFSSKVCVPPATVSVTPSTVMVWSLMVSVVLSLAQV
jgi:hypothetical protein